MRRTALVLTVTLLAVSPAFGQTPEPESHPYGLDPYKPSDAALLRELGATLVAQTPVSELRKLDPYKPSHAALLRELGGAFPLWGLSWYPTPTLMPTPLSPFQTLTFAIQPAPVAVAPTPAAPAEALAVYTGVPQPASSIATLHRPENNDGVWISFEQQKWIAAGRPVPFDESAFVRAGQYGEFPVFRRAGARESMIYLPTRDGLIAPYRLKP
jgi:hypothetical protein